MSDWYMDLIPRRSDETPDEAVDRVYEVDREPLSETEAEASRESVGFVSQDSRAFMLATVDRLLSLDVGLEVVGTERQAGRRWPHFIELESEFAALNVQIDQDCLSLRPLEHAETDEHWRLWWTVIRYFVADGFVACASDGLEVLRIHPSWSAARARRELWIF